MPVPTRIPSTSRRTPLVKAIDPVKFSLSRTAIEQVGAGGKDLLTAGSIGQLSLRIQSLLNVAARRIHLDPATVSIQTIIDEITVLSRVPRLPPTLRNKVDSAQIAISEAQTIKVSLVEAVQSQAAVDVLRTRKTVRSQVANSSLREELLALIDGISRSTRFG